MCETSVVIRSEANASSEHLVKAPHRPTVDLSESGKCDSRLVWKGPERAPP